MKKIRGTAKEEYTALGTVKQKETTRAISEVEKRERAAKIEAAESKKKSRNGKKR